MGTRSGVVRGSAMVTDDAASVEDDALPALLPRPRPPALLPLPLPLPRLRPVILSTIRYSKPWDSSYLLGTSSLASWV